MCWVQSVRANCRRSLMAAKRRASRRAARKEKSGERTAVELIRVNKMHIKANTGFRRKAFSGESAWKLKIAYSKRLALSCPAIRTFSTRDFRIAGYPSRVGSNAKLRR